MVCEITSEDVVDDTSSHAESVSTAVSTGPVAWKRLVVVWVLVVVAVDSVGIIVIVSVTVSVKVTVGVLDSVSVGVT